MNNNELKIMVPNSWFINEELMADGSRILVIKPNVIMDKNTADSKQREGIFKKVPASELSLEDDFLKYNPKTERERQFKKEVKNVIKAGIRDFWRPIYDPFIDENGHICYESGKRPTVDKSYAWWSVSAKYYWHERGSRLGTRSEYIAFLAVLIKELIASGKSAKWAWNAVCNDSKELGHVGNSLYNCLGVEPTGSREVCGWYDLGNTTKLLSPDNGGWGYWTAGSGWFCEDVVYPISLLGEDDDYELVDEFSCGWLVLEQCPDC